MYEKSGSFFKENNTVDTHNTMQSFDAILSWMRRRSNLTNMCREQNVNVETIDAKHVYQKKNEFKYLESKE